MAECKPSDDSQKVAVVSDISTSMDVEDDGSNSRAGRAQKMMQGHSGRTQRHRQRGELPV